MINLIIQQCNMKKKVIIIVIVLAIIAVATGLVIFMNSDKKEGGTNTNQNTEKVSVKIETTEDLTKLVDDINAKASLEIGLMTNIIDMTDEYMFSSSTGLTNTENIEAVVVSEPMISSQAYSLVLVKVSEDTDVEKVKKEMIDNIDMRKWICVSADVAYATNYEDVICLVMSSEEWAKPSYDAFKEYVGNNIGEELTRKFE